MAKKLNDYPITYCKPEYVEHLNKNLAVEPSWVKVCRQLAAIATLGLLIAISPIVAEFVLSFKGQDMGTVVSRLGNGLSQASAWALALGNSVPQAPQYDGAMVFIAAVTFGAILGSALLLWALAPKK